MRAIAEYARQMFAGAQNMAIGNWDEIRTAFHVARLGTVSAAAEALGVHHATVIRHIDALEARLGAKLFQRHARGYTATDAGRELLSVAQVADERFSQMAARIGGARDDISGDLIVTSLPGLTNLVVPAILRLLAAHPDLAVRYITDPRVFRLEYGEAHVALRVGARPQDPDNVVQPLLTENYAVYGARSYLDRHGRPSGDEDLFGHRFVGPEDTRHRAPFWRWLLDRVPPEALVFRSNDLPATAEAVVGGAGLGFMPVASAAGIDTVEQVLAPRPEWQVPVWLVTHVDLHRTAKVQAMLGAVKDVARELCANVLASGRG
jgi:DNA-binding transcriptional LysR family regulator